MSRGIDSPSGTAVMAPQLSEMLDVLLENERQMARFYEAMADCFVEHRATWNSLREQEMSHAEALERIRQAAEQRPYLFATGKCGVGAVRMAIADTKDMIARLQRQEVHPRYALTFAMDKENSILESRLDLAISTDVLEVRHLLNRLQHETLLHRQLLSNLLATTMAS